MSLGFVSHELFSQGRYQKRINIQVIIFPYASVVVLLRLETLQKKIKCFDNILTVSFFNIYNKYPK